LLIGVIRAVIKECRKGIAGKGGGELKAGKGKEESKK